MESTNVIETLFFSVRNTFSGFLLNIILSLTIILVGFVLGRMIGRLIIIFLKEIELSLIISKILKKKINIEEFIGNTIKYCIYIIIISIALNQLNLLIYTIYSLSLCIFLFIIVTLSLAIRDLIPNLFANFKLKIKKRLKKDDIISINNIKGKIKNIYITGINIISTEGDLISLPNTYILENKVNKIQE
jgi:small conductance mechanosensitive channel